MTKLRNLVIANKFYNYIREELDEDISLTDNNKEYITMIPFNVNLDTVDEFELRTLTKVLFDFILSKNNIFTNNLGSIRTILNFKLIISNDEIDEVLSW